MTFEDPTWLRATWGNKFLVNSKIAKPYAQPWVKFDHAEFERSGRAQRQVKGFCIPAKNASMIVVMVDYQIKDGYITHVMHARGIPPCGK